MNCMHQLASGMGTAAAILVAASVAAEAQAHIEPAQRRPSTQNTTFSPGTTSCARSASRVRSSRFGNFTYGTRRKIGNVAAPRSVLAGADGFRNVAVPHSRGGEIENLLCWRLSGRSRFLPPA